MVHLTGAALVPYNQGAVGEDSRREIATANDCLWPAAHLPRYGRQERRGSCLWKGSAGKVMAQFTMRASWPAGMTTRSEQIPQ